jgi:hypothetical protein
MKSNVYKRQIIMFIVMVVIGMLFNPMNILAYRFSDLYISQTLFYGGLGEQECKQFKDKIIRNVIKEVMVNKF